MADTNKRVGRRKPGSAIKQGVQAMKQEMDKRLFTKQSTKKGGMR